MSSTTSPASKDPRDGPRSQGSFDRASRRDDLDGNRPLVKKIGTEYADSPAGNPPNSAAYFIPHSITIPTSYCLRLMGNRKATEEYAVKNHVQSATLLLPEGERRPRKWLELENHYPRFERVTRLDRSRDRGKQTQRDRRRGRNGRAWLFAAYRTSSCS